MISRNAVEQLPDLGPVNRIDSKTSLCGRQPLGGNHADNPFRGQRYFPLERSSVSIHGLCEIYEPVSTARATRDVRRNYYCFLTHLMQNV